MSLSGARPAPHRARIGVAVLGLGYWGPNLLRVLAEDPRVVVRWLCDCDRERLDRYGRRYTGARRTTDFSRVLRDPAVDAVLIATPVGTHFDLALQSLRARKHTFVEKPLAHSSVLADQLAGIAREHDRVLMCGQTFIYSPPVRAVKRLLDEGSLGRVYYVSSSRVNLGLHQRDASVIWDLGPHDFSILLYWLGEMPQSIAALGRDSIVSGIADVAFISMTFPSGVVANVELSWLSPSKLRRTVLVGSEKMIIYDDGTPEPVRLFDHGVVYKDPESFGEYQLSYRTGDIVSPRLDTCEPLVLELDDFVKAIAAGDPLPYESMLARSVVRVVEAADNSLRRCGETIRLRDADLHALERATSLGSALV